MNRCCRRTGDLLIDDRPEQVLVDGAGSLDSQLMAVVRLDDLFEGGFIFQKNRDRFLPATAVWEKSGLSHGLSPSLEMACCDQRSLSRPGLGKIFDGKRLLRLTSSNS